MGCVAVAASLMAVHGCGDHESRACVTLGREGGVLQSHDSVLTIAIQPEALDEAQQFCISPSDAPPEAFGAAYLVAPPMPLNFEALVSYRGAMPEDPSVLNVGRISEHEFSIGRGKWTSLSGCRVDEAARNVQCADDGLSKFYGLLDRFVGDDEPVALGSSGDLPDPITGSAGTVTTVTTVTTGDSDPDTSSGTGDDGDDSTSTGDPPQPIEYPPECADLYRGPYEVVNAGLRFLPVGYDGSEDMAPDGHGGFIARSGAVLARLDVTGGTLGLIEDPGFVVRELEATPVLVDPTLGVRYAPSGDLLLAFYGLGRLRSMAPDGTMTTLVNGLSTPNGVYIGLDGVAWYTDTLDDSVQRLDLADNGAASEDIAMLSSANGVLHDPLRGLVFYGGGNTGELWRVPIGRSGSPGQPVRVATLDAALDGLAMDVCGNLYAVDRGPAAALLRVFMDDRGELIEVETIATGIETAPSNAVFGVGEAYGAFARALFLVGSSGEVAYVDLQTPGAAIPTREAPPPTVHVANGSFEQMPLPEGTWDYPAPPAKWEIYDPAGVMNGITTAVGTINCVGTYLYPDGAPVADHGALVFLWTDAGIPAGLSQRLATRLEANTEYVLRVFVGDPLDPPDGPFSFSGFPGYRIELAAGSTVLVADENTIIVPEGEFAQTELSYVAAPDDPNLGELLEVRLINLSAAPGVEIEFDGVELEVVPIPMPMP